MAIPLSLAEISNGVVKLLIVELSSSHNMHNY